MIGFFFGVLHGLLIIQRATGETDASWWLILLPTLTIAVALGAVWLVFKFHK